MRESSSPRTTALDSHANRVHSLFMMNTPMTAAVAKSILVEIAVEDRLASCRGLPRVAEAIAMLGESVALELYRAELKSWSKRRARWAKAKKAA